MHTTNIKVGLTAMVVSLSVSFSLLTATRKFSYGIYSEIELQRTKKKTKNKRDQLSIKKIIVQINKHKKEEAEEEECEQLINH